MPTSASVFFDLPFCPLLDFLASEYIAQPTVVMAYPAKPVIVTGLRNRLIDTAVATAPFRFPSTWAVRGEV